MGKRNYNTVTHRFFCTHCGQEGLPIARKRGHLKEHLHKKKLFCIYCGQEYNHVECVTDEDVKEFKERFEQGEYKDDEEFVPNDWSKWVG